jgi:hypothetical protein
MNVPLEKYCTMVWDCGQRALSLVHDALYIPMQLLEQMDLDFACPERGLVKIPQIGNVIIGNNVEMAPTLVWIVEI